MDGYINSQIVGRIFHWTNLEVKIFIPRAWEITQFTRCTFLSHKCKSYVQTRIIRALAYLGFTKKYARSSFWKVELVGETLISYWNLTSLCLIWCIWREHNNCMFEDVESSANQLLASFVGSSSLDLGLETHN